MLALEEHIRLLLVLLWLSPSLPRVPSG